MPDYNVLIDDATSFNLLLLGRHGANVDTIIFANINSASRRVTLVSLPRDLYVESEDLTARKINSIYGDFGVREQVRWIEEVLGHKIHKYALVDMYVFRDLIDLIGGVDIVLEQDLVDPTYKTCDNGVCSTLYYEAGEHHLNGTQALRVARSRHTTSDYSRAARQQIILEGIQQKALSLGFGDAGNLRAIVSTAVNALETNITVDEALRYYFRYQAFDLRRGAVISTGNILDNVIEPVDFPSSRIAWQCGEDLLKEKPNEILLETGACEEQFVIDTLQPKDGDWNSIPWFVQNQLY